MCGLNGQLNVYDETSLSLVQSIQAHTQQINRIRQSPFSPYYVVTCSNDWLVKVWRPNTNEWLLIRTYTGHTQGPEGIEFISNDVIATSGADNTIQIWLFHIK